MTYPRKLTVLEFEFLSLHKQFILHEPLQDKEDIETVFRHVFGKNEDIIQIHKDKMVQKVSEDTSNQNMEDSRSIN